MNNSSSAFPGLEVVGDSYILHSFLVRTVVSHCVMTFIILVLDKTSVTLRSIKVIMYVISSLPTVLFEKKILPAGTIGAVFCIKKSWSGN